MLYILWQTISNLVEPYATPDFSSPMFLVYVLSIFVSCPLVKIFKKKPLGFMGFGLLSAALVIGILIIIFKVNSVLIEPNIINYPGIKPVLAFSPFIIMAIEGKWAYFIWVKFMEAPTKQTNSPSIEGLKN